MNQFCECNQDGFCTRYQREMRGRFREICAGVNCDLGTAAAFREQWARERIADASPLDPPIPLLLKTNQAPGDAVVMTAAIYSLHRAHPGRYLTAVESPYPEVFAHNPDVHYHVEPNSVEEPFHWTEPLPLQMHYPAIHQSNHRGIHFMQAWCSFLGSALGIDVPLLTNRPHLYFNKPAPLGDFWVICSSGKSDFTNKMWGQHNYQEVVRSMPDIVFVQTGDSVANHPRLEGVVDAVGKTTLRELFDLVRCARGVVCGVSLLMHIAAALEKPSVVIAGGREPVQWNSYPKMRYLHTVGSLPCSSPQGDIDGGCWRSRVVPLGDNAILDKDTCLYPMSNPVLPRCMSLITPRYVIETIRQIEGVKNG